jgi:hypothetical protein
MFSERHRTQRTKTTESASRQQSVLQVKLRQLSLPRCRPRETIAPFVTKRSKTCYCWQHADLREDHPHGVHETLDGKLRQDDLRIL